MILNILYQNVELDDPLQYQCVYFNIEVYVLIFDEFHQIKTNYYFMSCLIPYILLQTSYFCI